MYEEEEEGEEGEEEKEEEEEERRAQRYENRFMMRMGAVNTRHNDSRSVTFQIRHVQHDL